MYKLHPPVKSVSGPISKRIAISAVDALRNLTVCGDISPLYLRIFDYIVLKSL